MRVLAHHTLLELHGCDAAVLSNADTLRPALLGAVKEGGGTIVTEVFHTFSPHGVSGMIVIAESHVAIHTWPEYGYAAVDIFSCSELLDHALVEKRIAAALGAKEIQRRAVQRG